jgi:Ca-activated chloride channel homolog
VNWLPDWTWVDRGYVHLVWAAIAVVTVLAVLELRARGALATFLSPVMQRRLSTQASLERTMARLVLVLGCLICGITALMRPQEPGRTELVAGAQPAADVMFVLDVSRSMLAEDAAPNRLARAKAEIDQLVSRLEGQRVGLVAFGGRAVLMCPLTPDHAFFTTVLASTDTRSAGRGGSRISDGIKAALKGFPREPGAKLIVLITDSASGPESEDQDPYKQEAAEAAKKAGVKIVAVGLGSEAGSQITITDPQTGAKTVLMHDGKPVISKLDGASLRKIALATEGAYIPAGTSAIDLDAIIDSHVRPIVSAAAEKSMRSVPAEHYPTLVMGALLCLLAALAIGAGTDRRSR